MIRALLFLCLLLPIFAASQVKDKKAFNEKIFYGGGIGLGFGTYTSIEISPQIGYKPVEDLYLGTKITYQYNSGSYILNNNSHDYSTSIYGGSVFVMCELFNKVVGYGEFEFLNVDKKMFHPLESGSEWLASPILGGGISQRVGGAKILLLLLWNLNESIYLPYSNPIFRISFMF